MAESPQISVDKMREYDLNSDLQLETKDDTCSIHTEEEQERDPDYVEERFRVDRRKLEHMIQAVGGRAQNAEDFFIQVMVDTSTQITWPSKLKIGAKSKKDPHIKVSGHKDAVAAAKDKIMAVLDTKSTRVTLKMDVSHTEHSHVIGKGGNNIKKVMQETGCHIHFPDSNRNNQAEKSNQVSIAGQPNGVEQARVKIRELLPLVFMFELPMTGVLQAIPDSSSPAVQQIQSQYGVTITFKQRPRVYATMVIIRGSVSNAKSIKEATLLLIERLTGTVGTAVPVSMQLEIAPQHHLFIIGRGGANIKQIMQRTGATIHFPDPTTVTPQRKGTVYITGPIDSVYCARNYLIGCLPLVLMFDMKEDVDIDQGSVSQLMEQLDVFISVKPKPKQPSKSVIVKSIERNAGNLYEARCRVLGIEGELPPGPPSADSYPNTSLGLQNLSLLGHNLLNVNTSPLLMLNRMQSPLPSPGSSPSPIIPSAQVYSPLMVFSPPPGYSALQSQFIAHTQNGFNKDLLQQQSALSRMTNPADKLTSGNTSSSESPQGSPASCTSPHLDFNLVSSTASAVSAVSAMLAANACGSLFTNNHPSLSAASLQGGQSGSGLAQGTGLAGPGLTGSSLQGSPTALSSDDLRGIGKLPGTNFVDSMFPRHMSPSSSSVDLFGSGRGSGSPLAGHNCSPLGSATGSPLNTPSSPAIKHRSVLLEDNLRNLHFQNGTEARSSESGCDSDGSDHNKAPGSNRPPKSYHHTQALFPGPGDVFTAVDYEKKKLMATKAMQKKPDGESRIPTDYWAGLGFSKSMPDTAIRERLKQSNVRYNGPTMTTTIEELSEELPPGCDIPLESAPQNYSTAGRHSPATPPLQHDSPRQHHPLGAPGPFSGPRKKVGDYGLSSSNHIDPSSKSTSSSWPPKTDLAELFSQLGLGKYTDLFTQQEIDLATFLTLTDQDLKELGISTFGARRKMILAIQEYNKKPAVHSVAPGSNNPFRDTGASSMMSGRRHDIASHSGRW